MSKPPSLTKTFMDCATDGNFLGASSILSEYPDAATWTTWGGWTALHQAAATGRTDVVRLLLDKGADIDAKTDTGCTALSWAALFQHEDTVRLLLDRGADADIADNSGHTALSLAYQRENPRIIEWIRCIHIERAEKARKEEFNESLKLFNTGLPHDIQGIKPVKFKNKPAK